MLVNCSYSRTYCIYTLNENITTDACKVLPASSERQQMLVDQNVKKFTKLLPCTLAVYDCRQLEDVSSVENVHSYRNPISSFNQMLSHSSSTIK